MELLKKIESVLDPIDSTFENKKMLRLAAILVPIFKESQNVLFIKRTMNTSHHQGQIAFPGGRFDEDDCNPLTTALRETNEEVSIDPQNITVIGRLTPTITTSRHYVYPFVGLIDESVDIKQNPSEVAEFFLAEFSDIMKPENFQKGFFRGSGIRSYYKVKNYRIWGVTAGIITDLLKRIRDE